MSVSKPLTLLDKYQKPTRGRGWGYPQTEMPRRKPRHDPKTQNVYAAAERAFATGRDLIAFRIDGISVGWQHSNAPAFIAAFHNS
jgi:hypothetical protein